MSKIYFYIPDSQWPEDICRDEPSYRWDANRFGKWNWTLQTFQHLNNSRFPCSMTSKLEQSGIVFAHRSVLPDDYIPSRNQLLVCILAERIRHPFAQYHVLQDPIQAVGFRRTLHSRFDRFFIGDSSRYVRYWSQPGLIPRNVDRGNLFENIVFKGMEGQLTDELKSDDFQQRVNELGLNWIIQSEKALWPDYSNVDAILAVRDFQMPNFSRKPATKLYNAWLAGVPAILGPEPTFQFEGNPCENYVEVGSVKDTLETLERMKNCVQFRNELVESGKKNAVHFSIEHLTSQWVCLIGDVLKPLLDRWSRFSVARRKFFLGGRKFFWGVRGVNKKLGRRFGVSVNPFI